MMENAPKIAISPQQKTTTSRTPKKRQYPIATNVYVQPHRIALISKFPNLLIRIISFRF